MLRLALAMLTLSATRRVLSLATPLFSLDVTVVYVTAMGAWKAQAVAARSYAVTHLIRPASQTYHLGDTTRWQVFSGTSSLSEQSSRATDETRGMVLSYRGGLVESLYASTQAISEEAHRHLGASMSQHGAQRLATQGLRFDEILGRYYQGASLAQLRRDGS